MHKYEDAFAEVYFVLSNLSKEEYIRIPKEIIEAIKYNMNKNYKININEDLDIKEQEFLPETKAILFNLFRDYLSTPNQREKIIIMQKKEKIKNEKLKKDKYKKGLFTGSINKRKD